MKYLIVSDIHGSSLGGCRLKEALIREKPDCLLLLGDLLFGAYDGDPDFVAGLIRSHAEKVVAVAGNCDDVYEDQTRLGIDLEMRRELSCCGRKVIMQHRPFSAPLEKKAVLLYGHTHRKCLYEEDGVIFCNPGSIALPRDDCPGYAVLEPRRIALFNAINGLALSEILL